MIVLPTARAYRLLVMTAACLLPVCHAAENPGPADDDRYHSDNRSQQVMPPVLDEAPSFHGPGKITRNDLQGYTIHKASDVTSLASKVNRDALVLGKAESIYIPKSQSKLILNLGKDFRNCFKVVIDVRDFEKWGSKEPAEIGKLFEGMNLAVDGLVSLHQKQPQIVVTLPHQIRIVE